MKIQISALPSNELPQIFQRILTWKFMHPDLIFTLMKLPGNLSTTTPMLMAVKISEKISRLARLLEHQEN